MTHPVVHLMVREMSLVDIVQKLGDILDGELTDLKEQLEEGDELTAVFAIEDVVREAEAWLADHLSELRERPQ